MNAAFRTERRPVHDVGVEEVGGAAAAITRATLEMREHQRRLISDHLGRAAASGHRVTDRRFHQPIVTVATVREWLGVSNPAPNTPVGRLEENGLLRETIGHARDRRSRLEPCLRLFEDPEVSA